MTHGLFDLSLEFIDEGVQIEALVANASCCVLNLGPEQYIISNVGDTSFLCHNKAYSRQSDGCFYVVLSSTQILPNLIAIPELGVGRSPSRSINVHAWPYYPRPRWRGTLCGWVGALLAESGGGEEKK